MVDWEERLECLSDERDDLQVDNVRLRKAITRVLQEIECVCASRSVGKMDAEPQTCLSMALRIAREALEKP